MDNTESLHDLTSAYALDALEGESARDYEQHLASCERCREELTELTDVATSLTYAVDAPVPPPQLRERILSQARSERVNVIPLRRRWIVPVSAAAAIAALVAVGLGLWTSSLSHRLDRAQADQRRHERVADILASDSLLTKRLTFDGGRGKLVVTPSGESALVFYRLEPAAPGHVYEAWVAEKGKPRPAGLFSSGGAITAVPLDIPVPDGAQVMVTEEREGGVDLPTTPPLISVRT